ncbi:MAG TPA: hypothetical protein EYG73_00560, partial [Arcobacter sp.]|nr:hypothetical protein [Arcobacter sp.]
INYIANTINTTVSKIGNSLSKVTTILNEYKNNDYRKKMDETLFRGGELQNLLNGINNLQEGITNRISQGYQTGLTLEYQANILQNEVSNLSNCTIEQASNIESTASAIEQVSANISQNTNIAINMHNASSNLKDSAEKNSILTTNTIESMNNISLSTECVYDAISVISKIAFQTNILSLNAAVEAATAGEAGKGFAVVAQEVRNLANRSAEAAKTIESLMDNLREETMKGKEYSLKMSEEFNILNKNIINTISLVDDIVSSSKEQGLGIEQINQSIQNIDRATHQNVLSTQKVKDISLQTYEIANKLVTANDNVEFVGKELILINSSEVYIDDK